ncbi:hypothetical protein [Ahrensia sp. 13_GOM-1096m]|uniref:hypothetical protein n=1 Tax=Ahrensia sp. 13_GOM-1096m TaxID=1380380 RepID=UPI00068908A1|nr:hypothetical protein [Ahrensia sp. 13_GOM-1096m]
MTHAQTMIGLRAFTALLVALSLAACTSTDSSLGVETATQVSTPSVVVPTANTGVELASNQPNTTLGNVYFAPIVGAPVSKITTFSKRLSSAAPLNSIKLQGSNSNTVDHEIRGYFSAFSESGQTTIIHVWDVFTPQGQRVHRIQGQEKVAGTGTEPWSVVPEATMQQIADSVLKQYTSWRSTS